MQAAFLHLFRNARNDGLFRGSAWSAFVPPDSAFLHLFGVVGMVGWGRWWCPTTRRTQECGECAPREVREVRREKREVGGRERLRGDGVMFLQLGMTHRAGSFGRYPPVAKQGRHKVGNPTGRVRYMGKHERTASWLGGRQIDEAALKVFPVTGVRTFRIVILLGGRFVR
jgi:hypothetical protein